MSPDPPNTYYDTAAVEDMVAAGSHRAAVGGLWDEIGQLQLDFLVLRGLLPEHKVLDVGCGSLRLGVKLVRYLNAENYFGTDLNASLLEAGYNVELRSEGLQHKLPREHLVAGGEFDFSWSPVAFDVVIAQSVFTHLPLNFLRVCLERLHGVVVPGANFFATIFEVPDDHPTHLPFEHRGGVTTYGAADPYHYRFVDMEFCCRNLPWTAIRVGDWDHPRGQHMVAFVRTDARG